MSDNCSIFVRKLIEKNDSPMPIIGVYVAAASLACSFAMLRNSAIKLNMDMSGRFFALNATWLTLLAVATKLTGDLTSPMWSPKDNIVKITSTAFLTMAMGCFFTTLGSMNDTDALTTRTALTILVITVVADLCIQLRTGALDYSLFPEIIFAMVLLLCMFITFFCSALAVPAIKKRAELNYQMLASEYEQMKRKQHTVEELRLSVTKYWVMAASGNPQFLMKRLVTFIFSSIISLLSAIIILLAVYRAGSEYEKWISFHCRHESDYKWSVIFIILFQSAVMVVSVTTSTIFLISVMGDKYEDNGIKISREEFTIESYWIEKLVDWRQSSISMRLKKRTVRKLLYNIKCLILTLCILLQTVIVMWCKFCCVISFYSMLPLVFLVNRLGKIFHKNEVLNYEKRREVDLNCFVILLEGERQLPKRFLRKIINRVDEHVEMGKMQRPKNLFNLLNHSFSFTGVVEFDSNQVPTLLSSEPPNCWTLPVVTLTSIAIALPNIASQYVDELVSSVDEGLRYASLVDVLDNKCGLKNTKNVADVVWVGVELHREWLGMDLNDKIGKANSAKEIIQTLADVAEQIVMEFSSTKNKILVQNPLYWPANVLAANSMYRISRTILLLFYENGECEVEELFKKLICMIADILAACLTNLPHVIVTKCKCNNSIEERKKNVCDATILLGETEDILKRFEKYQLSNIGPNQPLCIDEWRRRWMERQVPIVSASASSVESNEHVVVQMQA